MKAKIKITAIGIFFAVISSILIISTCGGGDEDSASFNELLAVMDITNATNLFLAKSSGSKISALNHGSRAIDSQKLFKITDEGYILDVKYFDDEGNQIEGIEDSDRSCRRGTPSSWAPLLSSLRD